jgi:hypothetical protein
MYFKPLKIFTSLIFFSSLPFLFRGLGLFAFSLGSSSAGSVEFNRDIRPILSDNCYTCHGPDKANRKTSLRLDNEASVFTDLGGHQAVVPGDPKLPSSGNGSSRVRNGRSTGRSSLQLRQTSPK